MNTKNKRSCLPVCLLVTVLLLCNLYAAYAIGLFGRSVPIEPQPSVSVSDSVLSDSSVSPSDAEVTATDIADKGPDTVTLQMTGDILIHSSVTNAARTGTNTYDFTPYLSMVTDAYKADIRITNLETPVDVYGGNESLESYPCFNVPIEILDAIKSINVNIVSTATNHSIDQGYDGAAKTLENVRASGLTALGAYITEEESKVPFITEVNGIKVGIINCTSVANIPIRGETAFMVNHCKNTPDDIVAHVVPQVDALKANGAELVVLIIHWGAEYTDNPTKDQRRAAEALCNAGVDIIFGGHSHSVQPIEMITVDRGGVESKALIAYSLGNFMANQTGIEEKVGPKTQYGMIVSVKAQRDEDGIVRLSDAFYTPTYCYVRGKEGSSFMRVLYSGCFALSEDVKFEDYTDVFRNENAFNTCKKAWKHVTSVAGDSIPAIASPADYPEGFFTAD